MGLTRRSRRRGIGDFTSVWLLGLFLNAPLLENSLHKQHPLRKVPANQPLRRVFRGPDPRHPMSKMQELAVACPPYSVPAAVNWEGSAAGFVVRGFAGSSGKSQI